ncbi:MAG: LacI family DNA-binding transcriptional regulator [Chloroflexota bacterium]
MATTIKDIARLAGVSIKTVSRVINNEPHVTEATRARVQAAIRTAGYAPNLLARRLVRQRADMIGILTYPGYYQAASGALPKIMDIGYQEGYDILFEPYYPSRKTSKDRLAELVNGRRFDGFVTTPPCDQDAFVAELMTTYKMPLVQINPLERTQTVPFIAPDDLRGAQLAMQHLLGLGHRRIAFLMGPRNMRASFDRFTGYRNALEAAGIPFDTALVQDTEFTYDGGYTATRLLMQQPFPPTAIYAANDESAYGVLFAAQELGLHIPAQLSVCGHEDLIYSKAIWPGLTTVHQPADELTEHAVRLLIALLKGQGPARRQVILPARLVVRASTASASPAVLPV